jgi:hypothetical protein
MNRRRVLGLSVSFIICSWLSATAAPAADGEKDFLWKVTAADGGEVYLLGSIHLGKKDWYPLPKEIEEAFEKSKFLVVEVDISKVDQAKMGAFLMQKGMYKAGDSVNKHVAKETGEKISAYLEDSGQPAAVLMQMKPWALSLMVTELEMKKLGFDGSEGVDRHFLNEANDKKKQVLELETMDAQLGLISGFDDDLQEKMLLSTLEEMGNIKTDLPKMVTAWQKGDPKALEEIFNKGVNKHPEFKPFMAKMLDDRNVGMVEKIEGYLKTKDLHFVVVGAGHLCGEKGIVKMLEGKKYKVEQIAKSAAAKEKEAVGAEK